MFLGDGYPNGSNNLFYSNNDHANNHRRWSLLTGTRAFVHQNQYRYYYRNQTSYSGNCFRVMPIRNNGTGSVTVTVKMLCQLILRQPVTAARA